MCWAMRWMIPALLLALLLPVKASALRLHDRLPVVTARFLVQCPAGTRRRARSLRRNVLQQRVTIEQPTWEVRCETAKAIANGPAVRVRHSYRANQLALANASFFLAQRLVWAGSYRNGKRNGTWKQFSRKGELLGSVELTAGTGTWRGWRSNGELAAEGTLLNDLEQGEWRYWYGNERLAMVGSFTRGTRQGRWKRFNRDESLRSDVSFVGGNRHGLSTQWHSNGEKRFEGGYHQGARDGKWAYWNVRGELLGINEVAKGTGRWMEWRDNGELRATGYHKAGKRQGHWKFYGRDGRLTEEGDYDNGRRQQASWKRYRGGYGNGSKAGNGSKTTKRKKMLRGLFGRRKVTNARMGRIGARVKTLKMLGGGGLGLKGGAAVAYGSGGPSLRGHASGGVAGRGAGNTGLNKTNTKNTTTGSLRAGRQGHGRAQGKLPVVTLSFKSTGGMRPDNGQLRRVETIVRFCTVSYDIRRLRKAAQGSVKRQLGTVRAGIEALVSIDSLGRASSVRLTRNDKRLDTLWHSCVQRGLKVLRFNNVASNSGASVEVAVTVK
jgi:antitoxin component YwqK of YwqJK toxin-antitoxin module